MNFFKLTRRASRPGTAAYARDLANVCRDIDGFGPTDATIVEAALRSRAACGLRRAAAALVGAGLVAIPMIIGIEDRNGDGRVDVADLVLGVKSAFAPSAMPARFDGRR